MQLPLPEQSIPGPAYILAAYQPPSIPPSEVAPSSAGKSLSCPTEGPSQEAPERVQETPSPFVLFDHDDTYDPDIRLRPLELEPPSSSDESNESTSGLFPWKFEFLWQSEELLFSGEPLSTGQTMGPSTEASGAVIGGSSAASATGYTIQESIVSSGTMDPQALDRAICCEEEIAMEISERRVYFVRLLEDHYWRTHPPQRSDKRNSSQVRHSGISTSSRSTAKHVASTSQAFGQAGSSRKGKGLNTGSASDEEDDNEDGNGTTPTSRSSGPKEGTRYFACPFLKWKALEYDGCMLRFRTILLMIGHLEEKHSILRCGRCGVTFGSRNKMKKHETTGCMVPLNLSSRPGVVSISKDQWDLIKTRKRKYQSDDQRWHSIFSILFPNSAPPESIHFEGKMNEIIAGVISYVETAGLSELRRLQEERSRDDPFAYRHESRDEQTDAIISEFIPRLTQRLRSSYMTQEDEGCSYDRQHMIQSASLPFQAGTASQELTFAQGPAQQATEAEPSYFTRLPVIPEEPSGYTTPTIGETAPYPGWNEASTDSFRSYMGHGHQIPLNCNPTEQFKLAPDAQNFHLQNSALNYSQFLTSPAYFGHPSMVNHAPQEAFPGDFDACLPLINVQDTLPHEGLIKNGTTGSELHFDTSLPLVWPDDKGLEYSNFFIN